MSDRSKAFFINGGAGRVLCSIPALEKYAEESGDEDFVIVCEGGMDFYRGHPSLQARAFEPTHKGLFENHLKDKDMISPEPYRVWEYYNQKASLTECYDIEINGHKEGFDLSDRDLQSPTIILSKTESIHGFQAIQEMKAKTGKAKTIVFQPFGRGVTREGDFIYDSSSRSFEFGTITKIINELRKRYCVIVMSEFEFPVDTDDKNPVPIPQNIDLRHWAAIINAADHFLGCDSVGQHIAKSMGKTATVVTGSTYPINISYPDEPSFDIFDVGKNKRVYQPIRVVMDDMADRINNECMMMTPEEEVAIINSCIDSLGDATIYETEEETLPTYKGVTDSTTENFVEI